MGTRGTRPSERPSECAFTMVEIAICLAIIGFALVAIIGVLPLGMNTQRDNREETVINQDATVLLEAVRNGTRGANDLTNYVYAITNYQMKFPASGVPTPNVYGYINYPSYLTNGTNIIGLMSTPEFTDVFGVPVSSLINGGFSNHIVAYVRSLSGLAAEKPPQDNPIMKEDTFSYRILCVNAPVPFDTNIFNLPPAQRQYVNQLSANLHELRMTFLWPQLPNGKLGNGHQTFRATIAGQIARTNDLYFYQSQSFTNAP
jgi:type II secretory pathway pseudopilin PulG